MYIRKLRLQRGWSQEQLSQLSGLSVRTIQRIERGQKAGLETLKSLAAVFDLDVIELMPKSDTNMNKTLELDEEENHIIEQVKEIKGFYSHAITYVLVIFGLFIFNFLRSPHHIWAWWPAFGWGIGLASHGLSAFEVVNLFGADWERRQIEKRLGRKL